KALAFDLLTIGDDSHVGADTTLTGCSVEDGVLKIAPITIGVRCFVGTRSVLGPGATMGDDAWLGDLSSVRPNGTVRSSQRRAGSRAAPVAASETATASAEPYLPSAGRRVVFAVLCALAIPVFPAIIVAAILPALLLLSMAGYGLTSY